MVAGVKKVAADWKYDAVSIGYPGPVLHGRPVAEPRHLGPGWVGFDYRSRLRMSGQGRQRRRDAGAGQLPGRQDALPRPGNRAGLDPHRRRHRGADGAGPPAVPGWHVRGVRRTARPARSRARAMAAATSRTSSAVSSPRSSQRTSCSGAATSSSSTPCQPAVGPATTPTRSSEGSDCGSERPSSVALHSDPRHHAARNRGVTPRKGRAQP